MEDLRAVRGWQQLGIPADRWQDVPLEQRNRLLNVASITAEADAERAKIEAKKNRDKTPPNPGKKPPGYRPG